MIIIILKYSVGSPGSRQGASLAAITLSHPGDPPALLDAFIVHVYHHFFTY